MKYINTAINNGEEFVVTVLSLDVLQGLEPENLPEQTYIVSDDVQKGWIKQEDGSFAPRNKTNEELIAELTRQIQKRLDTFANTRGYDGILSACTYATSAMQKFAVEGQYCVNKRDETWSTGYAIMAEVLGGQRPVPSSIADIEPELPVLEWPC